MTPGEGENDVIAWRFVSAPTGHREKLEEIALTLPAPASISLDFRNVLRIAAVILVPVAFWFLPLNLEPKAQHSIAVSLFMILGWATEIMDHGLTGLTGCYLFWALKVVNFEVAFSGFANDTPWFLMGAILFGTIASKSGLANRLAVDIVAISAGDRFAARWNHVSTR